MSIRADFSIDWNVNPRIITIAAPSVECTQQDLLDTLRHLEAQTSAMDNKPIVSASGKEPLGGGTKVGLTVSLLDALIAFEGRAGPQWTLCSIFGGNLVSFEADGITTQSPIHNTAFVNVSLTSSSSATLQEQEALQYSSFGGGVSIDVTSSISGTEFPAGTQEFPVNNVQDAVTIANNRGFSELQVRGGLTLTAGDDIRGFKIVGTSHINSGLVIEPEALCNKTRFESFYITGTLDGDSEVRDCTVGDIMYFNGHIHNSALAGNIYLSGGAVANMTDCNILDFNNIPVIDLGGTGQDLIMTNYSGILTLTNLTGVATVGIGMDSGQITIDDTCVAGTVFVQGTGTVTDNSADGCYVVDKVIDGSELDNLQSLVEHLRPHHTGTGNVWFWNPYSGNDIWAGDHPDRGFKTFAAAHDAAGNANHDIIMIVPADPSGVTTITEAITITKDYLFLRGPGRDVIFEHASEAVSIQTSARGTEISGFRIHNTTAGAVGLHSTGAFTMADNIWFEYCANGVLAETHHPILKSCKIHGASGYGIKMVGEISHGEIDNCTIGDAGESAVQIDTTATSGGIKMVDTIITGSAAYGIELSATTRKFMANDSNIVKHNDLGNWLDNSSAKDNICMTDENTKDVWEYVI